MKNDTKISDSDLATIFKEEFPNDTFVQSSEILTEEEFQAALALFLPQEENPSHNLNTSSTQNPNAMTNQ